MRRTTAAWVLGAALALVSGRAMATDNKGDIGGKGGLGPKTSTNDDTSPDTPTPILRNVDQANKKAEQEHPWELGASFETHRLYAQDDTEGEGSSKVFNYFGVYAQYRITETDTVGVQGGFTESFIADPGETGVRATDVSASYSRSVPLPRDFLFSAMVSLSAPTSFASQKEGLITAPRLNLTLNKKLGRYVNVAAHAGGGAFITRYAEAEGGAPNPFASLSLGLSAELIVPFHEPLSIGIAVSESYLWIHNVQSGDPTIVESGVVADATYTNQPVQQSYGGEIYARYTLPTLAGVKSDITIAIADGDPSLAYNSYLHSGVGYTYLFDRLTAEGYAAFTVRY